ncbi:MAG: phage virion morphogenesis protein [Candidatus Xenobium sp.]|jgi:phage virion morphogenesis protein
MARLIIDLDTFAAEKKLQGLLEAGRDLKPLLINLGTQALREFNKNFRAQGRPKWQPLHPKTLYRRKKSGRGGKILRDTGRLQQSLSQGKPGNIYRLEPRSLTVGTNLKYAAIHQFGGIVKLRPRSDMTPRTFARVGNRLLLRGKDGKVRVGSKLDGTPIRRKFAAAASVRMTFKARTIRIPARPYLVIPPEALNIFKRHVKQWIKENLT